MATAVTYSRDELEQLHKDIGVSRTVLSELLQNHTPEELRKSYADFTEYTKKAIAFEFKNPAFTIEGKPYLSAVQAARALGTGEFHLSNLRDRNKLSGRRHGRRVVYSRGDLHALLKPTKQDKHRAPLAVAFVRWLDLRGP